MNVLKLVNKGTKGALRISDIILELNGVPLDYKRITLSLDLSKSPFLIDNIIITGDKKLTLSDLSGYLIELFSDQFSITGEGYKEEKWVMMSPVILSCHGIPIKRTEKVTIDIDHTATVFKIYIICAF
jgi:hypothetical protein